MPIIYRAPGTCITRRSGIGRLTSARSDFSSSASCCSSAGCRRFWFSRCANWWPEHRRKKNRFTRIQIRIDCMAADPRIYGLVAEFDTGEALMEAARRTHAAGYRRAEAYSPYPMHGLAEALGRGPTAVPLLVLIGGIIG